MEHKFTVYRRRYTRKKLLTDLITFGISALMRWIIPKLLGNSNPGDHR